MCTLEKNGNLFILTLTGSSDKDEHRLSIDVMGSILSALSQARAQAATGSVLITTSRGKFFSNGLDLAWAKAAGSSTQARERLVHMLRVFKSVVAEYISLPMPTIAAVNGHAAAVGCALALCHDYVIMKRNRGVLYMSEVDMGFTFPYCFAALFRAKVGSAQALRDIMLRGAKISGEEAVRMGIVESAAHDTEKEVGEASVRLGEQLSSRKWNGEVYAEIRKSLYPDLCGALGLVKKVVASSKL